MFVKKEVARKIKEFQQYLAEVCEEINQITDELSEDVEYAKYHGHIKDAERMCDDGARLCKYGIALGMLGIVVTQTKELFED